MKALRLRTLCTYIFCIFSVLVLLPPEIISTTNSLVRNVGQDVVFMWNRTSGSIDEVRWGLFNQAAQNKISPQFIYVSSWANVAVYSNDLDTPAASRYKGRVHYVGNVPAGRAWFKITNLSISDTNEYAVSILEGRVYASFKVVLTVAATPRFQPLPPLTTTITEGQDLRVPCTAVGPPAPNVTWIRTAGHVTMSTGTGSATLSITTVGRDQNGSMFECHTWNNPNEKSVTAQTVVIINYPPQATIIPASLAVLGGEEIVLNCAVDGNPPPSISWTKDNGVIKAGHTVAGGTLRIPAAIKTDADKYICTANNTYDSKEHSDTATAIVNVKYQPSIMLGKLKDQTVNETDSFSIRCDADGYPTPTIKWKTPTGSVYTGNVYIIQSVSRSDAGTYTCTASNGIGREAIVSIQVIVQFKPIIIDKSQTPTQTRSWNGNSIRLRCFATGLPAPQITWYNPTRQQMTTGISIVPGGIEVTVLTTAGQGDYGQYTCRATNILGSDENVINVTQLFPPGRVNMTIAKIEASSITVRWIKPVYDGGLPVTCYLLEISTKPPVITVNTHDVITGLKARTQYTVKVYAHNAAGYGTVSSSVVRTKEKGKPAVPVIVYALLESSSSGSKLSVVLRWEEPDSNGGNITSYTVYIKEVIKQQSDWTKYVDIEGPNHFEYRVTENIVHGKTYMFMVTAWNKYGESVRDEKVAKTVNTTVSKAISASGVRISSEEGSKLSSTVFGIILALLVLSLGFNVLQFVYIRKRVQPRSRSKGRSTSSEMSSKKDATGESYENEFELEANVSSASALASPARKPVQTAPEYETINQRAESVNSSKEARPSINTSDYQELDMLPNTSIQGPVYEPLRTRPDKSREQHSNNGQHPYEPLNVRNQNTTYQSLHSNGNESAI